jgi:hypothetical protein
MLWPVLFLDHRWCAHRHHRVVFRAAQAHLGRPHQFQRGGQPQAALARQCNGFEFRAGLVAGAGKADADLMAAEHGVFPFRRRVLLIEEQIGDFIEPRGTSLNLAEA